MANITLEPTHITNQPAAGNPFEQLDNEWSVKLFSCFDNISQCCYAYWCFCCFLGSLADKIDESKLSCCCVPNVLSMYRMKVRSILRIEGDSCNDYCIASCCSVCAALQMSNELKNRNINKSNRSSNYNKNTH
ncbi:unnamed protein product [Adineta steineri]|uniref:Uncharacterized protein n=1 Tax=Adineta steineri TaxID=433720 RepID=A0A814PVW7_9BILA|nr:unnamed protein product [Adineta steineri]CAF3972666.1 unnamed protein product [Adineta steineri]